jgi:hypothetical protein
LLWK